MYGQFHQQIPIANPTLAQELRFATHSIGRDLFASNFARGGASSILFGYNRSFGENLKQAFTPKASIGSPEHLANMRRIHALDPSNTKLGEKISKLEKQGSRMFNLGGKLMGAGMFAAMVLIPAITTPGHIKEKARAVTTGMAGMAGWGVGSRIGMVAGASFGTAVPFFGTLIGGAIGYVAGGLLGEMAAGGLADAITRIPDKLVERQVRGRKLNWAQSNAAFSTSKAYTMRQHALMAMNRGHMSARSLMGQEAVFLHQ